MGVWEFSVEPVIIVIIPTVWTVFQHSMTAAAHCFMSSYRNYVVMHINFTYLDRKTCSFWTGNAAKMIYLENTEIVESLSRLKRHLLHFRKAGNLRPDLYHLQLYLIWRFEGSSRTIPAASAFILSYTGVAGDMEDNTKNVTSHNMLDVGSHTSLLHPCLLQSDNGSKIYHRDGTMEASSQYQHHHNLDWWQLIPTPVTTVKL